MATKSILKSINIKSRKSALAMVNANENASGKHAQDVTRNRAFSDASRDEIRKMFGKEQKNP